MSVRLLIALLAILAPRGSAFAEITHYWSVNFATSINGSQPIRSIVGANPSAFDGVDSRDKSWEISASSGCLTQSQFAFAFTIVDAAVLTNDYRQTPTNTAKTWNIFLMASEPGIISMDISMPISFILFPISNVLPISSTESANLPILLDGSAIIWPPSIRPPRVSTDYGLSSLVLWQGSEEVCSLLPRSTSGFTKTFAYDGTPIALRLVATPYATPEPGSLVALLVGCCGLYGYCRRRSSLQ